MGHWSQEGAAWWAEGTCTLGGITQWCCPLRSGEKPSLLWESPFNSRATVTLRGRKLEHSFHRGCPLDPLPQPPLASAYSAMHTQTYMCQFTRTHNIHTPPTLCLCIENAWKFFQRGVLEWQGLKDTVSWKGCPDPSEDRTWLGLRGVVRAMGYGRIMRTAPHPRVFLFLLPEDHLLFC